MSKNIIHNFQHKTNKKAIQNDKCSNTDQLKLQKDSLCFGSEEILNDFHNVNPPTIFSFEGEKKQRKKHLL